MEPQLHYRLAAEATEIDAEIAELHKRKAWLTLRMEGPALRQSKRGAGDLEREILGYLEENGTASMTDVAINVIVTRQLAYGVLRRLITRGLVEKVGIGKYKAL